MKKNLISICLGLALFSGCAVLSQLPTWWNTLVVIVNTAADVLNAIDNIVNSKDSPVKFTTYSKSECLARLEEARLALAEVPHKMKELKDSGLELTDEQINKAILGDFIKKYDRLYTLLKEEGIIYAVRLPKTRTGIIIPSSKIFEYKSK